MGKENNWTALAIHQLLSEHNAKQNAILKSETEFLESMGWSRSQDDAMWAVGMWQKELPDGRTLVVKRDIAMRYEEETNPLNADW